MVKQLAIRIPRYNLAVGVFNLIAFLGGNFKILGAEISEKVPSKWVRFTCLVFGIGALLIAFKINPLARMQGQMLDTDLPGGYLRTVITNSPEYCASACQADSNCREYTFKSSEQRCFLKDSQPKPLASGGLVSGYKK